MAKRAAMETRRHQKTFQLQVFASPQLRSLLYYLQHFMNAEFDGFLRFMWISQYSDSYSFSNFSFFWRKRWKLETFPFWNITTSLKFHVDTMIRRKTENIKLTVHITILDIRRENDKNTAKNEWEMKRQDMKDIFQLSTVRLLQINLFVVGKTIGNLQKTFFSLHFLFLFALIPLHRHQSSSDRERRTRKFDIGKRKSWREERKMFFHRINTMPTQLSLSNRR